MVPHCVYLNGYIFINVIDIGKLEGYNIHVPFRLQIIKEWF